MKHFLLHAAVLTATGLLVQGCAPLAPGFSSAGGDAAKAVSPSGFSSPGIDPPPAGALTEITPTLIQAQRAAIADATRVTPEVRALVGPPQDYRIGPGDVVGIVVYDHPELVSSGIPATTVADAASVSPAPGYIVSSSGMLSFPYAGSIKVTGMGIQEVENTLVQRLSKVFKSPQLTVRVVAFRSKRVYLDGEVRQPGLQVMTDIPMTLAEALNRAGGVSAAGDRSAINLTRDGRITPIDLNALADAGIDPNTIPLRSGDMIYVRNREERKVTVMGEVTQQAGILMRNGKLSLNDALTEVGGVNLATANPLQIYVIRNEPTGGQSIFHLDARTPTAIAMADGFALRAKDVVYVDPVPLVQWNRVISLILPTSGVVTSYRAAINPNLAP